MCYNKEISITTFAISLGVIALLLNRDKPNDRFVSLYIFITSIMQLVEYFIWTNIEIGNRRLNILYTLFANIIILIQPIVIVAGLYFLANTHHISVNNNNNNNNNKHKKWLRILLIISGSITIYAFYKYFNRESLEPSFVSAKNKNLVWGNSKPLQELDYWGYISYVFYALTIIFSPLLLKPMREGVFITLVALITLFFSFNKSFNEDSAIHKTSWKSVWCNMANIGFVIYYFFTNINT